MRYAVQCWAIYERNKFYKPSFLHSRGIWRGLLNCIGYWIVSLSLCELDWQCIVYINVTCLQGSVGFQWSSFGGLFYILLMDRFTLFVCFTLMGTYQAGPSLTKAVRRLQYTHLKEKRGVNFHSVGSNINEVFTAANRMLLSLPFFGRLELCLLQLKKTCNVYGVMKCQRKCDNLFLHFLSFTKP